MNRRLWWIGATGAFASVCLSASVLLARQGVIRTKDGRTMEGDIEEKPEQVSIVIRGIRTNIDRDRIEGQVEYFDNVEARYKDKVSKLPAKPTAQDHLGLARWLFDVKQYDLAQREIDEAKRIDPNNAEAVTLEQTVLSQRRLDKAKTGNAGTTPRPPANTGGAATPPPAAGGGGGGERPHYLTADDINKVRQMEWRENDNVAPRATVPMDVRKRYVEMKAINNAEFSSLTGQQQAYAILSDPDTDAEMRDKIKITSDPQSLMDYRRVVQPLILNNCATAGCHGGKGAGDFMLFANNPEREDVAYTNFYILQSYAANNGEHLMIDRTYPERSLLAQYALNPDSAEIDHPALKGQTYKAMAANKAAPSYQTLVNWMKSLRAGEPKYGIKYDLPGGAKKAEAEKKAAEAAKKPAEPEKKPAAQPQQPPAGTGTKPPAGARPPTTPRPPAVNGNK
jgi:hypothetical protein